MIALRRPQVLTREVRIQAPEARGEFDEALHPRGPGGKFASICDAGGEVGGGGANAQTHQLARHRMEWPADALERIASGTPGQRSVISVGRAHGGTTSNEVHRVDIEGNDGRILGVIWKPLSGQYPKDGQLRPGEVPVVPYGTQHLREAATSHVADLLGIDRVPPTIVRSMEDGSGSAQLVAQRTISVKDVASINREEAEAMRAFDYITGNSDRRPPNVRQDSHDPPRLVWIDNGVAFPEDHPWRITHPWDQVADHVGPVTDGTRAFIRGMDPAKLVQGCRESGISEKAATLALHRLLGLQRDPDRIRLASGAVRIPGQLKMVTRVDRDASSDYISTLAAEPGQRLPPDDLVRAAKIVEAHYGKRGE